VRALDAEGVTHAAYIGASDAKRGRRAVLVVESEPRRAPTLERTLRETIAPWPIDELRVVRRIPRDPRHASKTDVESLRNALDLR
jgi:hypothetical protein